MARVFVRAGFGRHRKIRELRKLLECNRHEAMGIVLSLWISVMEQQVWDGRLVGWTPEHIAEECFWTEDPDTLVRALLKAGFLDQQDGHYCVHDWAREQGQLINRLAADRARGKDNPEKVEEAEEIAEDDETGRKAAELVRLWNSYKGDVQYVTPKKGIHSLDFYVKRGLTLDEVVAAISDKAGCAGKKLWELLDAMEKKKGRPSGGIASETMDRIKQKFLEGGQGS